MPPPRPLLTICGPLHHELLQAVTDSGRIKGRNPLQSKRRRGPKQGHQGRGRETGHPGERRETRRTAAKAGGGVAESIPVDIVGRFVARTKFKKVLGRYPGHQGQVEMPGNRPRDLDIEPAAR